MTAQPYVLLVHGAMRRRSTYRWTRELQGYLKSKGLQDTHVFLWSGWVSRSAVDEAAAQLAAALRSRYRVQDHGALQPLRVYAKSTGALVFRRAFAMLVETGQAPRCEILLQVAAPNPPEMESSLDLVEKLINIYSPEDRFLRFFINIGLFPGHRQTVAGYGVARFRDIEVRGVRHDDFNWDIRLPTNSLAGRHLYEVYYSLLSDGIVQN